MTGPSKTDSHPLLTPLLRFSYVFVIIAICILGGTFAGVAFGFVINYTQSAPIGLYRAISDPAHASHDPAPYVYFCPDVRWPTLRGQLNYREPSHGCPDGFSPLIKPVVAWPGDTVMLSSVGVAVNGRLIDRTALIDMDSKGHPVHHYPYGVYPVPNGQLWVVSNFSPRSFDSRYFGPIPLRSVHSWIQPFIVQAKYRPQLSRK